ncbi:hypothetical protein [Clavibacter michiganensis]|nr:hypothetical protein [Clavibacter michiganensis]MBE3077353.1 hypothetical protein [Clavibacter michiganensis subsp. michiganensis]MDO4019668.1 hypothetical protein [Clavibacter michiganensis]MDO4036077.1 hypothetical protein [Clavibacter michiganensis]MDO4039359.1 hypothetical protein [Clavibacter michiganensis]MDO4042641.1 hypothetical protein [Clavibacter michiganensis]
MTAIAFSGVVVSQASYSAFVASTEIPDNSWSTETLSMQNDHATAPLFAEKDVSAGSSGQKYITIQWTNSVKAKLALYGKSSTKDPVLDNAINLTIKEGGFNAAGKFGLITGGLNYSGTLANFIADHSSYSTGLHNTPNSAYQPTGSTTYEISWSVDDSTVPSGWAGRSTTADLVWEEQRG